MSRPRALLIGSAADPHVIEVLAALGRDADPVIADTGTLEESRFALHLEEFRLWGNGSAIPEVIGAGDRGWIRRLAPPGWTEGATVGTLKAAIRTAWLTMMAGVARLPGVQWLTPLDDLLRAEDKLVQYRAAQTCGLGVPATAVCSRVEDIPDVFGDPLVLKPLGPGHYTDAEGAPRVLFASEVSARSLELQDLRGAPFLIQEKVEVTHHVRVVTVRDRAWAWRLEASDVGLDWRRTPGAHRRFAAAPLSVPAAAGALALADAMSVGFSSQDWAMTTDGPIFLDLNPSGQWLFLGGLQASAVTKAIADWLGAVT